MDDKSRIAIVNYWDQDDLELEVDDNTTDLDVNKARYQFGNHLGSASLELDDSGQIISYEEYFPYGGTSFIAGNNQAEVKLKEYRYTGKERDDSTGFYYYGARYYAPWTGRWLSADPAGPVDGLNLYVYVSGNPVKLVDPEGMAEDEPQSTPKPNGNQHIIPLSKDEQARMETARRYPGGVMHASGGGGVARDPIEEVKGAGEGLLEATEGLATDIADTALDVLLPWRKAEKDFEKLKGVAEFLSDPAGHLAKAIENVKTAAKAVADKAQNDPRFRGKVGGHVLFNAILIIAIRKISGSLGGLLSRVKSAPGAAAEGAAVEGAAAEVVSAEAQAATRLPKIHMGKQGKHIAGHNNFDSSRSVLTADPKSLASQAGSGQQVGKLKVGRPGSKERVKFEKTIGEYKDQSGASKPTSVGIIHYSKDGIHIVPGRPE